jgi:hypothetical protein
MDLEEAITNLRTASEEDTLKTTALKELQGKVESLNHATRVRREKLRKGSKFNSVSMVSLAVACFAVIGMFSLYNSFDHDAPIRVVALQEELEGMKKNEEFYLQLKKNLEAENEELVLENNNLNILTTSLSEEAEELKEQLSYRDYEYDSLKAKLMESQEELATLISLEKEAQFEQSLVDVDPSELYVPLIPQEFLEEIKDWSQLNSTLAFPCEVKVVNEAVVLSDLALSASIEVEVGSTMTVTRFHPVSEEYVVARQGDSDTFMASVHLDNTNVMEVLADKYVAHMKSIGRRISNPFLSNRFSQVDKNFSEEN